MARGADLKKWKTRAERTKLHRLADIVVITPCAVIGEADRWAVMKPWSDVLQMLRWGCATEWKQSYPAYAVDARLDHSRRVPDKHYLMIADSSGDGVGRVGHGDATESAAQGAAVGPAHRPAGR